MFRPGTARSRRRRHRVAIGTGDKAPEFDLEEAAGKPRVRLSDYLGRSNVLLVFHPFAFTAICAEEAMDLQENLDSFRNANTEIVFVSCDASAARQAWRKELGAEYTFASDFWSHGESTKRYGVFNDETGAPIRGTFLIDRDGTVVWSLVNDADTRRTEMVPDSLETLHETT
jgi:peroxiredoxin